MPGWGEGREELPGAARKLRGIMATFVIFITVMTSKLIKLCTLSIMQFLVPKCYLSKVVKK